MKTKLLGVVAAFVLALNVLVSSPPAMAITYNTTIIFLSNNNLSGPLDKITGSIEADCFNCVLTTENIISWDLTVTLREGTSEEFIFSLTSATPNNFFTISGNDLYAEEHDEYVDKYFLFFNFHDTDNGSVMIYNAFGAFTVKNTIPCSGEQCGYYEYVGAFIFDKYSDPSFTDSVTSTGSYTPLHSGPLRATPIPSAALLFATGLGLLSLLGWRRKRKQVAA